MPANITEAQRQDYLKEEYLFLQAQYEDYDTRSLTIKSWIGTGAVGALALSFDSSYSQNPKFLIAAVAVVVCVVWFLEAYWKIFQHGFSDRIRVIEAYFRDDPDIIEKQPAPFQIYHAWFISRTEDEPIYPDEHKTRPRPFWVRLLKQSLQPFVCLPYFPILVLCGASFAIR
jgi:hypothetical protein